MLTHFALGVCDKKLDWQQQLFPFGRSQSVNRSVCQLVGQLVFLLLFCIHFAGCRPVRVLHNLQLTVIWPIAEGFDFSAALLFTSHGWLCHISAVSFSLSLSVSLSFSLSLSLVLFLTLSLSISFAYLQATSSEKPDRIFEQGEQVCNCVKYCEHPKAHCIMWPYRSALRHLSASSVVLSPTTITQSAHYNGIMNRYSAAATSQLPVECL